MEISGIIIGSLIGSFCGSFAGSMLYNWWAEDLYFRYVGWRMKRKSRKEAEI